RLHAPAFEVFDGGQRVPYLESPERMEVILQALQKRDWAEILPPTNFGLVPLSRVHARDYLTFLASAWTGWRATEPQAGAAADGFPLLPATFTRPGQQRRPASILGQAGYYMMDLSAPITAGTHTAALSAAHCALSAGKAVLEGERAAFALCRPPGHHAGKAYCGGYCYLNNAAIVADWLCANGKVTILDIDYHAGNGTQEIFYDRADVLTLSLHADPAEEYPYFSGYADEQGIAAGLGFHRNFPMPAGTGDDAYLQTLHKALRLLTDFAPRFLVLSLGMDIYREDPLGKFDITAQGIQQIARRIADLGLPTVLVLEGGYHTAALGENVATFLEAFL
ncbi:MAG: histone deacetylase family protein, partial [Anaerolineae bacterium]